MFKQSLPNTISASAAPRGAWLKALTMVLLACVLMLPALGASATASVRQGGISTFAPTFLQSPAGAWAIYNPSGTLIAALGPPSPGTNGWNVNIITSSNASGAQYISSITVTAPAAAPVGTSYKVVVAGPGNTNAAFFDVTSASVNPTVHRGSGNTFAPILFQTPNASWAIYNSSGTLIAAQGPPSPGTNGWNVSAQTTNGGGGLYVSAITVFAPSGATVATNYKVVVSAPGPINTAYFDVIP